MKDNDSKLKIEVQSLPAGVDFESLRDGVYDTGERRHVDSHYDILTNERYHDCILRKVVRIDDGTEILPNIEVNRRRDGKRILIGWDILHHGETFRDQALRNYGPHTAR